MKKDKWYQVVIHHPISNAILEHRKRTFWRWRTAQQHANDIKRTWALQCRVTLEEV